MPAKKVIAKVVDNVILSKNDFKILSKFVAAQFVRTPARLHKQLGLNRNSFNEGRRSLDRFLHDILWTILSADEGHYLSAIGGQNPSAQALNNGPWSKTKRLDHTGDRLKC